MSRIIGKVDDRGLYLPATVMLSEGYARALKKASRLKPDGGSADVAAIVDTGAACSVLDVSIIRQLGLPNRGQIQAHTPTTRGKSETLPTYDGTLVLRGDREPPLHLALEFVEAELLSQHFHLLIGRDALCHCKLAYVGRSARFRLSW